MHPVQDKSHAKRELGSAELTAPSPAAQVLAGGSHSVPTVCLFFNLDTRFWRTQPVAAVLSQPPG